jgi:Arm DNA-binding domain
MAKLTKRAVDALSPRRKAYAAYDSELRGFGVRVMPGGHKSFIVEYRPHGGGRGNATRRLTLGAYGALTPDQARRAAQEDHLDPHSAWPPFFDGAGSNATPVASAVPVRTRVKTFILCLPSRCTPAGISARGPVPAAQRKLFALNRIFSPPEMVISTEWGRYTVCCVTLLRRTR